MSLLTADFDYTLPPELIARYPLERREASRMLVLHRATGQIEHRQFSDFPSYLREGDLVVLNDTRVVPARFFSDDGRIEFLFLEALGEHHWKCLVKPGRKMKLGARVVVQGRTGVVQQIFPEGERLVQFDGPIDLDAIGELPIPPYFERPAEALDSERYQTVYARERGAVAAPTAGLHFTPEMLANIPHAFVTLHVGVGTFRSVLSDEVAGHRMHSERFRLPAATAEAINRARRTVAIGTTTTRVLESCARDGLPLHETEGATDIFIYPPYQFQVVGALLTNFHLPKSTLLMLVSAFAGREAVLAAYEAAIQECYRFYSYGDCMLIV